MKKWGKVIRVASAALFVACLVYLYYSGKQCEAVFGIESIYCQD